MDPTTDKKNGNYTGLDETLKTVSQVKRSKQN
jgi:hypothetical protein